MNGFCNILQNVIVFITEFKVKTWASIARLGVLTPHTQTAYRVPGL